MENGIKITVPSKHTEQMIRAEVVDMLGIGHVSGAPGEKRPRLCLGHLMQLAIIKSPYIYGGVIMAEDVEAAQAIFGVDNSAKSVFHQGLLDAMDAAFRPLELFDDPDDPDEGKTRKSDVRSFSPEWMADVIRAACQAVPSMTLDDVLWHIPLTMIMHLGVAEARANGSVTKRPVDYQALMQQYKQMRGPKHE